MIVHCRRCDTKYRTPGGAAAAETRCPECGAVNVAHEDEVIDAEFEIHTDETIEEAADIAYVIEEPEEEFDDDEEEEEDEGEFINEPQYKNAAPIEIHEEESPWGTERSYTVYMQRQMENNGLPCCSIGCLIFVLCTFLIVRGIISLF